MAQDRRRVKGARSALVCGALAFVGIQLLLDLGVVARCPEVYDPEYAWHLKTLRARLAEKPNRPLLVLVGSSRTKVSFLPEQLPPLRTASGAEVVAFNFSHFMAGPVMNLQEVRRLLRNGIRPQWLVVELMPPWLGDASQYIALTTAGQDDFPVTRRYLKPTSVYGSFLKRQLVPAYQHRRFLAGRAIPEWIAEDDAEQVANSLGGHPQLFGPDPDPPTVRQMTELARQDYSPQVQDLHIAEISDRATRELIDLCRQHGIALVLLLTPEGPSFQSWYSAESRQRIDRYCTALSQECHVPLIDARNWLDEVDFFDSHHVMLHGAEKFTSRLGREVLQPLVEGRLAEASPEQRAALRESPLGGTP